MDTTFKLVPADGIYAVKVYYERVEYKGMLYIGNRPTVNGVKRNIEVNIFDFNKDVYGDTLTVSFHHLIRNDSKFSDLEGLTKQLALDKIDALRLLN
jgi:riboflavin kinase/FMN adenylyltransferase